MNPLQIINESVRLDVSHHESENARRDRHLHRRRSSAVANIEGELLDEQARNIELARRNRELAEQLQKSKALAKLAMLESAGLAATIGHLHKVWKSGGDVSLDEVKDIMQEKMKSKASDPKAIEKAEKRLSSIEQSGRGNRLKP